MVISRTAGAGIGRPSSLRLSVAVATGLGQEKAAFRDGAPPADISGWRREPSDGA